MVVRGRSVDIKRRLGGRAVNILLRPTSEKAEPSIEKADSVLEKVEPDISGYYANRVRRGGSVP